MSVSLRAEARNAAQPALEAVVSASASGILVAVGPPGSGKTSALAARALALAAQGAVMVICSHDSGVRAFRQALLAATGDGGANAGDRGDFLGANIAIGTAPGHMLELLRSHFALAGLRPDVRAGGELAARDIVRVAARGLLDLAWRELYADDLDLNLPFLSRPDTFLDEAAALIRQLRSLRVHPDEFERSCAAGLSAFYGDEVEAALAKSRDPQVRAQVSRRGRDALGASPAVLQVQRRAERDLAVLLTRLYREYLHAAHTAALLSDEDIIDECVSWLARDETSARLIAENHAAILVDDGEDAHPGVADFLAVLLAAGLPGITIAGCADAAIDGLDGRRSLIQTFEPTQRMSLAPLHPVPAIVAQRFEHESDEIQHLATDLADLLRNAVAPADVALLTRSTDAAAVYARALEAHGLPVDAPLDAFAEPHAIHDWLALAAVVDDAYDHAHMLRVLASPMVGLADASIYALCEDTTAVTQLALDVGVNDERRRPAGARQRTALARNMLEGIVDARLPEPVRDTVQLFRAQLTSWREQYAGLPAAGVIARLAHAGGFTRHWEAAPAHRRARLLDDRQRVVEAFAADRESGAQRSLSELVRALEDHALPLRPAKRSATAIACDTITGAKGEHWPHVFVVGLAHERFPRIYTSRAMAFSRTYGVIPRENVAPGASQTAKFAWYYARFKAKDMYLAEEHRALGYGLSRASVSAKATGFGKPPRWAKDYDLLAALGG